MNVFIGLTSNDVEVSAPEYMRQKVSFGNASNGSSANTNEITFPTATCTWGVINGTRVYDAQKGGNDLLIMSLNSRIAVYAGMRVKFDIGSIIASIDGLSEYSKARVEEHILGPREHKCTCSMGDLMRTGCRCGGK